MTNDVNKTVDGSLSFYELMDELDKFCLEKADDYDFREVSVHSNKIESKEFIFLKSRQGKIIFTVCLNKGE